MTKNEIENYMEIINNLLWWLHGFNSTNTRGSLPDDWQAALVIVYNVLDEMKEKK